MPSLARDTKHELRCFCTRTPLLATYGIDSQGQLYVHIKIWKQRRLYGEVVITGGSVKVHCRECLRWHSINIRQPNRVTLEEVPNPDTAATS